MAASKWIKMKAYFGMEEFAKLDFQIPTQNDKLFIFNKYGLKYDLHSHDCNICSVHNV